MIRTHTGWQWCKGVCQGQLTCQASHPSSSPPSLLNAPCRSSLSWTCPASSCQTRHRCLPLDRVRPEPGSKGVYFRHVTSGLQYFITDYYVSQLKCVFKRQNPRNNGFNLVAYSTYHSTILHTIGKINSGLQKSLDSSRCRCVAKHEAYILPADSCLNFFPMETLNVYPTSESPELAC